MEQPQPIEKNQLIVESGKSNSAILKEMRAPADKVKSISRDRRRNLRTLLYEVSLGEKRILEEALWGMQAAKADGSLSMHLNYLKFLKAMFDLAYSDAPEEEPGAEGSTFNEFIDYISKNLTPQEAEVIVESLRGFKRTRERDL